MNDEKQIINDNIFKIINSNYFRRLKDKTQLFSSRNYECYRNRLTHSLEVKNIAFEIARRLKCEFIRINYDCNFELIEAISLAHDIGHTPFGHAGERYLDELFYVHTERHFSHNIHSVRVLDKIFPYNISLQ